MADSKISDLPLVSSVVAAQEFAVNDGGTSKKATAEQIAAYGRSVIPGGAMFTIDGGGSPITTGLKGFIPVVYNGTITGWKIYADVSGSIVVDVWKDVEASYPPAVGDTIAGSEKPTLSSQIINSDTNLSTWTPTVSAGDVLAFNVDSVSTVTRVVIILTITRT